ncbi:anaphase-promoting complex subunit 7 isoform X2 [Tachypleus tridentatus]|uniref:anaphase-promoting complex subunit 7 isoform X2 n=1 Tax=Tachypleus tridentatus TaxID=6853 RepID=UPI003FCF2B90
MSLFEQIKLLNSQELHSNVNVLASLVLTMSDQSPEMLLPTVKYQILVYYGESLYHTKNYRKAESVLRKALQLKKSMSKAKGKSQGLSPVEMTPEIDVKYQIYLCHFQLNQFNEAISILESIPGRQRTARINMALAKLYYQNGMERSAITSYKEVLKECPLAMQAALGLLALGVKGAEVASLMQNGTSTIPSIEWLPSWIKAFAHLHAREHQQSVATFKQLENKSLLRDCVDILVALGNAYYCNGDFANALMVLEKAHTLDPLGLRGMDLFAAVLAREKKLKELENLSSQLLSVSDVAPEPWIAMAYFCHATKKGTRGVYFAQKACLISPRNIEALLLKGFILTELKRVQDALVHFKEAYKIAPYRFEAHKDGYMALGRNREAIVYASNCCKQLGQSPRALCLYASVLAKDALSVEKAKTLLEKALKQDPNYLDAVYQIVEIYEQERQYQKGIELLKKQAEVQSTCRLHQLLGDLLSKINEHEKALHHFSIALNMDPTNPRALEGAQRVEQHPESLEGSYDVEVEDIGDSETGGELEESEVEAVWSDVEYS